MFDMALRVTGNDRRRFGGIEPYIRQPIESGVKRFLHLDAREMLADAEMRTVAETVMARFWAEDIKSLWLGENLFIARGQRGYRRRRQ